jgi:integrase
MARPQGQVKARGKDRWDISVFVGRDADGKRCYITRTVHGGKKKAGEALRALLAEHDRGRLGRPDHRPVGEYLDWWLANVATPRVRASTLESYRRVVKVYLKPDLGEIRLDKLSPLQVQELVRTLTEKGLAARTVRYALATLNGAMRKAVKLRLIIRNPCEDAEQPREAHREMQVPGEAARARLLAELQADSLWPLWCVLASGGLRPGEALGLKWSDLNVEAGVLTVARSLSRTGKGWELTEPKTAAGRRTVALPAEAVAVLTEHQERQRKAQDKIEKDHPDAVERNGLMFADALGHPLNWTNCRRRHFQLALQRATMTCATCGLPLRKAKDGALQHAGPVLVGGETPEAHPPAPFAELAGLVPYSLRHLSASLLLNGGVDLKTVSARLGHSTAAFTLSTYTHLVPGSQQAAAVAIGAALFGKATAKNGKRS